MRPSQRRDNAKVQQNTNTRAMGTSGIAGRGKEPVASDAPKNPISSEYYAREGMLLLTLAICLPPLGLVFGIVNWTNENPERRYIGRHATLMSIVSAFLIVLLYVIFIMR